MKNEVIMLRCHRIHYDQAIRVSGAQIVDVGFFDWSSPEDISAAIKDKTAAIVYVAKAETLSGSVPLKKVVTIAKESNIPVIVDAADELPPVSNLRRFIDMGADLAIFSGGKDLRGPQSSGIILGRKELIEACAINSNPNHSIGRPMKADKEAIVGLVKAVELYLKKDFNEEMATWEKQKCYLIETLSELPHVNVKSAEPVPGQPGSFYLPSVYVNLDEEGLSITANDVIEKLTKGNPGIVVDRSKTSIIIRVHMLQDGETDRVVARFKDILR